MPQQLRTALSIGSLCAFLVSGWTMPAMAQELVLPTPGARVALSPSFNPPLLKGIKVHPENPFQFEFVLDEGDGFVSPQALKEESAKLIKYFLASLTIPEKDLWVNLSPYEKDRIAPESFGQTEMGRDLLAQDYMLKQIAASLVYPEGEVGKEFWKRVYAKAKERGMTQVPVNAFNKVWIVPQKAVVYENPEAATAYVVESSMKVMLEEDYLAINKNSTTAASEQSQILRESIIPQLTKEINAGQNFAQLRQVYNSLILATWYKKKIKDSVFSKVYADQSKIVGVNIEDPQEKQEIYERYLEAFKKGVYNYIKEEMDPLTERLMPRKYFSGGVAFNAAMITKMETTNEVPQELPRQSALKRISAGVVVAAGGVPALAGVSDGAMNIEPTLPAAEPEETKTRRLHESLDKIIADYGLEEYLRMEKVYFPAFRSSFSQKVVATINAAFDLKNADLIDAIEQIIYPQLTTLSHPLAGSIPNFNSWLAYAVMHEHENFLGRIKFLVEINRPMACALIFGAVGAHTRREFTKADRLDAKVMPYLLRGFSQYFKQRLQDLEKFETAHGGIDAQEVRMEVTKMAGALFNGLLMRNHLNFYEFLRSLEIALQPVNFLDMVREAAKLLPAKMPRFMHFLNEKLGSLEMDRLSYVTDENHHHVTIDEIYMGPASKAAEQYMDKHEEYIRSWFHSKLATEQDALKKYHILKNLDSSVKSFADLLHADVDGAMAVRVPSGFPGRAWTPLDLRITEEVSRRTAELTAAIELEHRSEALISELQTVTALRKTADGAAKKELTHREAALARDIEALEQELKEPVGKHNVYQEHADFLKKLRNDRRLIYEAIGKADQNRNSKELHALNSKARAINPLVMKLQLQLARRILNNEAPVGGLRHAVALGTLQGVLHSIQLLQAELKFYLARLHARQKIRQVEGAVWRQQLERAFGSRDLNIETTLEETDAEPKIKIGREQSIHAHRRLKQIFVDIKKGRLSNANRNLDLLLRLYDVGYRSVLPKYQEIGRQLQGVKDSINGLNEGQVPEAALISGIGTVVEALRKAILYPKQKVWIEVEYKNISYALRSFRHRLSGYVTEIGTISGHKAMLEHYTGQLSQAAPRKGLSQRNLNIMLGRLNEIKNWVERGFVRPKQSAAIHLGPAIEDISEEAFAQGNLEISKVIAQLELRLKEIDEIVVHSQRQAEEIFRLYRDTDIKYRINDILANLEAGQLPQAKDKLDRIRELYFDVTKQEPYANEVLTQQKYLRIAGLLDGAGKLLAGSKVQGPDLKRSLGLILEEVQIRHTGVIAVDSAMLEKAGSRASMPELALDIVEALKGDSLAIEAFNKIYTSKNVQNYVIELMHKFMYVPGIQKVILKFAGISEQPHFGALGELIHAYFLQEDGYEIVAFALDEEDSVRRTVEFDILVRKKDGHFFFVEVKSSSGRRLEETSLVGGRFADVTDGYVEPKAWTDNIVLSIRNGKDKFDRVDDFWGKAKSPNFVSMLLVQDQLKRQMGERLARELIIELKAGPPRLIFSLTEKAGYVISKDDKMMIEKDGSRHPLPPDPQPNADDLNEISAHILSRAKVARFPTEVIFRPRLRVNRFGRIDEPKVPLDFKHLVDAVSLAARMAPEAIGAILKELTFYLSDRSIKEEQLDRALSELAKVHRMEPLQITVGGDHKSVTVLFPYVGVRMEFYAQEKELRARHMEYVYRSGLSRQQQEILLQRPIKDIPIANPEEFTGKTILITGAAGSMGEAVAHEFAKLPIKKIVLIDRNKEALEKELKPKFQGTNVDLQIRGLDTTDDIGLRQAIRDTLPDYIFHLAAFKFVNLGELELNREEAYATNVIATEKLIQLAHEFHTHRLVIASSDNANNPVSFYGGTKKAVEQMVQQFHPRSQARPTELVAVRFHNLLDSRGSLVPIVAQQLRKGNPIILFGKDTKRFFLPVQEAVASLINVGRSAPPRSIVVLKGGTEHEIMKVIERLAHVERKNPQIIVKPLPAGEKPTEELITAEELQRAQDKGDFWVLPAGNVGKDIFLTELLRFDAQEIRARMDYKGAPRAAGLRIRPPKQLVRVEREYRKADGTTLFLTDDARREGAFLEATGQERSISLKSFTFVVTDGSQRVGFIDFNVNEATKQIELNLSYTYGKFEQQGWATLGLALLKLYFVQSGWSDYEILSTPGPSEAGYMHSRQGAARIFKEVSEERIGDLRILHWKIEDAEKIRATLDLAMLQKTLAAGLLLLSTLGAVHELPADIAKLQELGVADLNPDYKALEIKLSAALEVEDIIKKIDALEAVVMEANAHLANGKLRSNEGQAWAQLQAKARLYWNFAFNWGQAERFYQLVKQGIPEQELIKFLTVLIEGLEGYQASLQDDGTKLGQVQNEIRKEVLALISTLRDFGEKYGIERRAPPYHLNSLEASVNKSPKQKHDSAQMPDQAMLGRSHFASQTTLSAVKNFSKKRFLRSEEGDEAMTLGLAQAKKGGIDLHTATRDLQLNNAGKDIQFKLDPAMLKQLQDARGFVPVILDIHPLVDLKLFLGV